MLAISSLASLIPTFFPESDLLFVEAHECYLHMFMHGPDYQNRTRLDAWLIKPMETSEMEGFLLLSSFH